MGIRVIHSALPTLSSAGHRITIHVKCNPLDNNKANTLCNLSDNTSKLSNCLSSLPNTTELQFLDESQVLHASFRVAAESVTQLYKTAFQQKNIGYEQCLKDLLEFIESHPNVQQRQQLGTDGRDAIISVDDLIKFMHLKKEQLSSLSRRSQSQFQISNQQIFEGIQNNFNFPVPLSNTTDNNNQNIQHEIDRLVPSQDDSKR
ncbi:4542_t:CDS:2 [Entrophospora sp. SA101]|nr:3752_t:CDS:2 [Entrophospora sp. SA101]CAJ0899601.1 4542_t:CDS:2 [Entrophospora sp. SA101]